MWCQLTDLPVPPIGPDRTIEVFGATLTLMATAAETRGAYSIVEGVYEPGGFGPLAHVHGDRDESFYVVDGQFDFRIDGSTFRGSPGSFLHVSRGTLHQFVNSGSSRARLLFIHAPALDGFFVELGQLARAGPANPETLEALMRAWGMDVVAP